MKTVFATLNCAAACIALLLMTACGSQNTKTQNPPKPHTVEIPKLPASLSKNDQQIYILDHYWEQFDASDTSWITDTAALEQLFAQWAFLLEQIPLQQATRYPAKLIQQAEKTPEMVLRLSELAEHYFDNPNSPYRNQELFIPVLQAILQTKTLEDIYKQRPREQLASALKNRPGTQAADLTYMTSSGQKRNLYSCKAPYTLLIFYNPECTDCSRTKYYIECSEVFSSLIADNILKVIAIYPDKNLQAWQNDLPQMPKSWIVGRCYIGNDGKSPYNLPAIPSLYLLDQNKTVLLKDAPVERIEDYLYKQR